MTNRLPTCLFAFVVWFALAPDVAALETPAPLQPNLILRYELRGKDEESLVSQAMIRAIKSATGRLYFARYMLRGRHVLDAYLEKNMPEFIARYEVHTSEIRGGQRFVDIEVVVDAKKLYAHLDRMHFLYRPAFRPVFYAYLAETFDGQPVSVPTGRRTLLEILNERQYRYLWAERADDPSVPISEKKEVRTRSPRPDQDATEDLETACRGAQRNGVEIFITGAIETKISRSEVIYFDKFSFVKTHCVLRLVRSDTGEVLSTAETTTAAGHTDVKEALRVATEAAVRDVVPRIVERYDKEWGKTILADKKWGDPALRKSNLVRIMVTGMDEPTLGALRQILAGVSPTAELYTRCAYADIAVLTLSWNGPTKDLINLLRRTEHPDFKMNQVEPDGFILEIL